MRYLYLHGFCSGPATFKGNFFRQRFAERGIDLITPDLNGGDFSRLTLTSQLEIVHREIDRSGEPVTLIGSSMGGYLAALLAQELPIVHQLVLIAPAFRFLSRFVELIGDEALAEWRRSGWMTVDHYQYHEPRPLHYAILEDAEKYEKIPLERALPALLFHGLHDETVPYSTSIDYLQWNPQAELVLFPSDHSLNTEIERMWRYLIARFPPDNR
ncbi:MAG: alpha/beta fold hydrolase [Gammaproteobacteria bacterium]